MFVTPLVPEKISYREGDLLIRVWEIFNNSTQEIKNLELMSISGDTCSKFYLARKYYFSFPEFVLLPKSSAVLTLKEKIFQTIPGIYKCQLRMSTVSRISPFGPLLTYELAIVNPNF